MLAINGYIVYLSIFFIFANKLKRTPVLDLPALYVNLALTTGFTLMTAYALFSCAGYLQVVGHTGAVKKGKHDHFSRHYCNGAVFY